MSALPLSTALPRLDEKGNSVWAVCCDSEPVVALTTLSEYP